MTANHAADVRHFHDIFDLPNPISPAWPDNDCIAMRLRLDKEETTELYEAVVARDFIGTVDALLDRLYVTYGFLVTMGVPINVCWDFVHAANMSKLPKNDIPLKRADGKILKPEGWQPPEPFIEQVLKRWDWDGK